MKTFFTLSLHLFITSFLYAQAPQGIPYQAVLRNADGTVMANSAADMTFMIHDGSAMGTVVYQESHPLTSNAQGLVACVVGNGVVSQGNFANINWGSGAKFLHVMMGSTDLGTQQMMSVPYALHANRVGVRASATGDTLTIGSNSIIVPGISAANPNHGGLGSQVLVGNTTCANEYISVTGCGGQTSLTYDGRTYDLVEIGGQCWFADNLATDQYRNGNPIPTGLDNTNWQNTTAGAYAIYNNDSANVATYGKLYNWYTTVDTRGLCPTGWHVPTDCEWMYLEGSLGMSVVDRETAGWRGTTEGGSLKATTNWNSPNTGSTNSSGFTALPGGLLNNFVTYFRMGSHAFWWSSAEFDSGNAWLRVLTYDNSYVLRGNNDKHIGLSMRCIKDAYLSNVNGCTDGSACNFLANATQDDGSCLYPNATCDDGNANTMNDVIGGNCVCTGVLMVNGCSNAQACNYDPSANVDNGSCLIQGTSCNDGNANTTNDVINANCQCAGTSTSSSGAGAQLLPGNATCSTQNISVTGCGGQTSLTYDGRTYDLVEIGGQCWFADNLATDQYRNGDLIPTGLENAIWSTTTSGAYAIYNNDPANDVTYGKLYNWYTTVDTRGLCPTGWHVPTDCEWMYLEGSLGMSVSEQEINGWRANVGGNMKATTGWNFPNTGATNSSGFTAFAGGYRFGNWPSYSNLGIVGYWWSNTEFASNSAWGRLIFYNNSVVNRFENVKKDGFSVRCLKD